METIGQRIQRKMLEDKRNWKRPQLRAALIKAGLKTISVEALRQYINGDIKPKANVRKYLAKVFNTTEQDIEFGTAGPQVEEQSVIYKRDEHPEARLLKAFGRLLPDQQKKYVEEIEALAETNMAMGQLVLREVKYSQSAENLPVAPPLPQPKKPSRTKKP